MSTKTKIFKVTNRSLLLYFQNLGIKYLDFFTSWRDHEIVFIFPKSKIVLGALHEWQEIHNQCQKSN